MNFLFEQEENFPPPRPPSNMMQLHQRGVRGHGRVGGQGHCLTQEGSLERRSDSPWLVKWVDRGTLSSLQTIFGVLVDTFKDICQQPPHPQTKATDTRFTPGQELILPRLRGPVPGIWSQTPEPCAGLLCT